MVSNPLPFIKFISVEYTKLFFLSPRLTKIAYTTGTITRVTTVEKMSPPITAIPIGFQSSEPDPELNDSGSIPSIVVSDVISTGLSLDLPDNAIASYSSLPLSRIRLIKSTRTIAFFTTIPIRSTAPIPDITLSVVLVKNKAIATPENANGMENIIMNGIFRDSN